MKRVLIMVVAVLLLLPANMQTAFASTASDIINTGEKYLGTPYDYGADVGNTSTFDCSSFTSWIFSRHGISLARMSRDQAKQGTYVSKSNLQVGDLLFYDTDYDGVINHVGVYAGNGQMLNASSSKGVSYAGAFSPYYWGDRYVTARRVIPAEAPPAPEPEPEIKALSFPTSADRLDGSNRFAVAANVSKEGWEDADTVYLANYNAFADALSAAPLAYKDNAPILLTRPNGLGSETTSEIKRLTPSKVVLIGGTGSINESVVNEIKNINANIQVDRIGGNDRFEVSYKISNKLGTAEKAVVANGLNYPDALAIAPYAARNGYPILLTAPNNLPSSIKKALTNVQESIVVGGEASVGKGVYDQLPTPMRIGGKNRFEVASNVITDLGQTPGQAFVATGLTFADALTGSVLAAKNNAPMLLTRSDSLPDSIRSVIEDKRIPSFKVLGGSASVSPELFEKLDGK